MINHPTKTIYTCKFNNWQKSVALILERSGLGPIAARQELILLKPNLVEILAPPITTPVELIQAILDYLLDFLPPHRVIIGEGCGATAYDTYHAFAELGYSAVAARRRIGLVDLNLEKLRRKELSYCSRWPEMYLPEILDHAFLISVPQLKAHSLAGVTLTMKNMMGCAPPAHYRGNGAWNKAAFHTNIHQAIFDLNRYRTPDFTLLDATIGMAQAHLWGPQCDPPVGRLAASFDPVAIDGYGTTLLDRNWRHIPHIAMANGILGDAENCEIIELE